MQILIDALMELGLTKNEARIYLALLCLKSANVHQISRESGVHRTNVYDSIQELINKNLAVLVKKNKGRNYKPQSPEKILELVNEKGKKIKEIIPHLFEIYN